MVYLYIYKFGTKGYKFAVSDSIESGHPLRILVYNEEVAKPWLKWLEHTFSAKRSAEGYYALNEQELEMAITLLKERRLTVAALLLYWFVCLCWWIGLALAIGISYLFQDKKLVSRWLSDHALPPPPRYKGQKKFYPKMIFTKYGITTKL